MNEVRPELKIVPKQLADETKRVDSQLLLRTGVHINKNLTKQLHNTLSTKWAVFNFAGDKIWCLLYFLELSNIVHCQIKVKLCLFGNGDFENLHLILQSHRSSAC